LGKLSHPVAAGRDVPGAARGIDAADALTGSRALPAASAVARTGSATWRERITLSMGSLHSIACGLSTGPAK
jgi:hypothetical protein